MGTPFKAAYGTNALELRGLAAIGCEAVTLGPDEFGYGTKELGKMLLAAEKKMPMWFYYQGQNLHNYPHFVFPMVRLFMNAGVLYGAEKG